MRPAILATALAAVLMSGGLAGADDGRRGDFRGTHRGGDFYRGRDRFDGPGFDRDRWNGGRHHRPGGYHGGGWGPRPHYPPRYPWYDPWCPRPYPYPYPWWRW